MSHLEHPGSACCLLHDMFEIAVCFGAVPLLLAASFCQQAVTMYVFMHRAVASPDAPQKPLGRKRARSGGVSYVKVSWGEVGAKAKKPAQPVRSNLRFLGRQPSAGRRSRWTLVAPLMKATCPLILVYCG